MPKLMLIGSLESDYLNLSLCTKKKREREKKLRLRLKSYCSRPITSRMSANMRDWLHKLDALDLVSFCFSLGQSVLPLQHIPGVSL